MVDEAVDYADILIGLRTDSFDIYMYKFSVLST